VYVQLKGSLVVHGTVCTTTVQKIWYISPRKVEFLELISMTCWPLIGPGIPRQGYCIAVGSAVCTFEHNVLIWTPSNS